MEQQDPSFRWKIASAIVVILNLAFFLLFFFVGINLEPGTILSDLICFPQIILYIMLMAVIANWVYKDAESHGMDGKLHALLVTMLLGVPGLFVYLYKRMRSRAVGALIYRDDVPGSPYYQAQQPDQIVNCRYCGYYHPLSLDVCPNCGRRS